MNHVNPKALKLIVLLLLLTTALTGCYAPYDPYIGKHKYNYAGDWKGKLTEQSASPQSADVNINILPHDYGNSSYSYSLNGSWDAQFSESRKALGVFQGYADSGSIDFRADMYFSEAPDCSATVSGSRTGDTISGIYTLFPLSENGCSEVEIKPGIFEITKQK